MKILSLYWGCNSNAAIFIDNSIIAATHEERFSRIKHDDVFPKSAIKYCLDEAAIRATDLDGVGIAGLEQSFDDTVVHKWRWDTEDYLREQYQKWKPYLVDRTSNLKPTLELFPADLTSYPSAYWKKMISLPYEIRQERFNKNREEIVAGFLGIDKNKVRRLEHHRCHALYAYYASPFREEKVLAFTIDGFGDGLNATIGIFDEKGNYTRVYATDQCNIGRIYRYITLLLGMKPNEHEYKVMGLAPYGKEKYAQKAIDIFKNTLYVDGIEFKWKVKPSDSYFWFKERLEGIRFDNIAYALQFWLEGLLVEWTKNGIKKFGIKKIVFSGGVAMNIKAIGKIIYLLDVEDIFVGGSPGDESLAIGAGICLAEDLIREKCGDWQGAAIKPLSQLYLGPKAAPGEESEIIKYLGKNKYKIFRNPTPKQIAQFLAKGKVLARCVDRMEFGERALGNRSILADPIDLRVKDRINAMIKNRDFWMPFAPVIMDRYVKKYLINPKNIESPHMTIGFNSTEVGYNAMIAACHPIDRTVRAQILRKEANPEFYRILEEFEKITGRGALLNTSFNLHGHPIVNTLQDALHVFEISGLEGLILNKYLIMKY